MTISTRIPANTDDTIDSRDIIARIDEIEADIAEQIEAETIRDDSDHEDWEELSVLRALAAEGADYAADWQYGEVLIRDDYFQDYAREIAEDISDYRPNVLQWPLTCIDWEQAARELRMDYSAIDFDGVTYWVR